MSKSVDQPLSGKIKKNTIVCVVGTDDDWDGLYGIVDEFFEEIGGVAIQPEDSPRYVSIFFPTSRRDVGDYGFQDLNMFSSSTRLELQKSDGLKLFPMENIEIADF